MNWMNESSVIVIAFVVIMLFVPAKSETALDDLVQSHYWTVETTIYSGH